MGPAQDIFLPKTLWDIIRVKNPTDSKIEAVFQSGTHDVGSSTMTAQNLSGKKDIMSIATILAYMVYNGFNQDINAALVYEKIWYIQNYSPMRDHALVFLHSCMVVIWRNTDTKPFSLHNQFQDKFPPQSRMWAQWRFEQLLSTLEIVVNIGIIPEMPHPPSQGSIQQPMQVVGYGGDTTQTRSKWTQQHFRKC